MVTRRLRNQHYTGVENGPNGHFKCCFFFSFCSSLSGGATITNNLSTYLGPGLSSDTQPFHIPRSWSMVRYTTFPHTQVLDYGPTHTQVLDYRPIHNLFTYPGPGVWSDTQPFHTPRSWSMVRYTTFPHTQVLDYGPIHNLSTYLGPGVWSDTHPFHIPRSWIMVRYTTFPPGIFKHKILSETFKF